jgi:hypothetical protein
VHQGDDIADVIVVFRCYLRELPEPLLTHALYETLIASVGTACDDEAKSISNLTIALRMLPADNLRMLTMLCKFLSGVANTQSDAADASTKLARAFAGIVARHESPTLESVLSDAAFSIQMLALFITKHSTLLQVRFRTKRLAVAVVDRFRRRRLFCTHARTQTGGAQPTVAEPNDAKFRERMEKNYRELRENMSSGNFISAVSTFLVHRCLLLTVARRCSWRRCRCGRTQCMLASEKSCARSTAKRKSRRSCSDAPTRFARARSTTRPCSYSIA